MGMCQLYYEDEETMDRQMPNDECIAKRNGQQEVAYVVSNELCNLWACANYAMKTTKPNR